MSKVTLNEIVSTMNAAPSGGFVGITNYESENGDVVSVTGLLGCSYGDTVALKIAGLKEAIANEDFEPITVKGQGYAKEVNGVLEFGRKSKDRKLVTFCHEYPKDEVIEVAKGILEAWE